MRGIKNKPQQKVDAHGDIIFCIATSLHFFDRIVIFVIFLVVGNFILFHFCWSVHSLWFAAQYKIDTEEEAEKKIEYVAFNIQMIWRAAFKSYWTITYINFFRSLFFFLHIFVRSSRCHCALVKQNFVKNEAHHLSHAWS